MINKKSQSCCSSSEPKVHRLNRQPYKHNTMKYCDYIKLIGYLSDNCTDKDYHKAMIKLDKFEIIVKD